LSVHLRAALNTWLSAVNDGVTDGVTTLEQAQAAAQIGLDTAVTHYQWDVEARRDEVDGVAI